MTTTHITARPTQSTTRPFWTVAIVSALGAAAATSAVAVIGDAAGVSLDVQGEPIPVSGFATLTLICAAIGIVLAVAIRRWAAQPRQTFTRVAVALTAVSLVPDVVVDAAVSTKVLLMATHVVAAAIMIPALASRLDERR